MVPPLDECKFCVREFWQPWLQQLLDIEDEARVEERKATFAIRDALSKSERDLAINLRLYAADAVLSIRSAKKDVMKAIAAIEAEKAKRKSIDKEKYGIEIKRSNANTRYKEAMDKAFKAKRLQENKFEIMKLWSDRWAIRQAEQYKEDEEEEEPPPQQKPLKSLLKHPDDQTDGSKISSYDLTQDEDYVSTLHKPTLKKKEDGQSVDTDHHAHEKKDSVHKHSSHNIRHSKDKLTTPSSHIVGPSAAHGADKGTAMPDKKTIQSPAHGADKGAVVIKEPVTAHEPAHHIEKTATELGRAPAADKPTTENSGSTHGHDKTATPHQAAEKHDSDKKEPAIAHSSDKAAHEKKEPSHSIDKGPTVNKAPPATATPAVAPPAVAPPVAAPPAAAPPAAAPKATAPPAGAPPATAPPATAPPATAPPAAAPPAARPAQDKKPEPPSPPSPPAPPKPETKPPPDPKKEPK